MNRKWTEEETNYLRDNRFTHSYEENAKCLGRTIGAVKSHCQKYGFVREDNSWTDSEIDYLKNNYLVQEHQEIAKYLGRTGNSVRNYCWKLGLRKGSEDWNESDTKTLVQYYGSHDVVDLDYLESIFPGRHRTNICRKAREFGLTDIHRTYGEDTRKLMSANMKAWIKDHGHPRGYLGHHPSSETRELISKAAKRMWANPNSKVNSEEHKQYQSDSMMRRQQEDAKMRRGYSRGKMGKRDDLGGLYVRSSWEANYCRYLNWLVSVGQIAKWEYETDEFEFTEIKRGTRTYLPDFKVYNLDGSVEYHEVKGWMDQKSATKLKRMAKYYPDIKIVLIDKDAYYAIARDVKMFIPNWETYHRKDR